MCEEMIKLRKWLDKQKIVWWDDSCTYDEMFFMHRTKLVLNGHEISIINGVGSYGGCVSAGCRNMGLLEMWIVGQGEPKGNLTADEVVKEIERCKAWMLGT